MPQAAYAVLTEQQQLDQLRIDQLPAHWQELNTDTIAAKIEEHRGELNIVNRTFGPDLNFFHRVVAVIFSCLAVHVVVSLQTTVDPEQARLTWTDLGGHDPGELGRLVQLVLGTIGVLGITAAGMKLGMLSSWVAALVAAAVTLVAFRINAQRRTRLADHDHSAHGQRWWSNDRTWAAVLCAAAVWMHFFFA